ncbi:uncharacterized protein TrAtP1_010771 [Trichoderma atroviride]|uniref:uncharacterized protein n=1 Tax=Hypocrea atroviridis TaxID=63577 RepID=UPI003323FB67|nr:hypothetical protein TrAtP1_010771 [Trichoderma atroviride]
MDHHSARDIDGLQCLCHGFPPLHTMARAEKLGCSQLSWNSMDGTSVCFGTLQVANKPQLRTAAAPTVPGRNTKVFFSKDGIAAAADDFHCGSCLSLDYLAGCM